MLDAAAIGTTLRLLVNKQTNKDRSSLKTTIADSQIGRNQTPFRRRIYIQIPIIPAVPF